MGRPGQYVLDFLRRNDYLGNSLHIHVWGAPFAAKKFIELVIRDDEWYWELEDDGTESNDSLVTSSGIRIRTNSTADRGMLREVMQHEYSLAEVAWDLPMPYPRLAQAWRVRRSWTDLRTVEQKVRRGTPRASRAGMVTVQNIAEELGIKPRDARGALRKAKMAKPVQGWAWKPDDVALIRELIAKAVGKAG